MHSIASINLNRTILKISNTLPHWIFFRVMLVLFLTTFVLPRTVMADAIESPTAPPLQISEWIQRTPMDITQPKPKTIPVILFWETWCDSCMTALPRIVTLQEALKDKGVTFIGVTPEPPGAVNSFLTNSDIGLTLNFTIACDKDRRTFEAYMAGFGRESVPMAFVLNDRGKIVWHGHPLAGLEEVLEKILAGRFDPKAAAKALAAEKLQIEYFRLAATNSESSTVSKLGRKIVSDGASNPWLLNNFAWRILTDSRLKTRDLKLANRASKAACDATDWSRASFLDTHAHALFAQGKSAEAIRVEKRALTNCTNSVLRSQLEQSLRKFETPPKQAALP